MTKKSTRNILDCMLSRYIASGYQCMYAELLSYAFFTDIISPREYKMLSSLLYVQGVF